MPYKSEKIKIAGTKHDRRRKLSENDKKIIKDLYEAGMSIRGITRKFPVTRRVIQYLLFPERLEKQKKLRRERGGWKQYYDKEKHKEAIKEHRHYKHKLYKENKIGKRTSDSGDYGYIEPLPGGEEGRSGSSDKGDFGGVSSDH